MTELTELWNKVSEIKTECKNIMDAIFAKHIDWDKTNNTNSFSCDTPIVWDSDSDDGVYVLDRIMKYDNGYLAVCSNSYETDEFSIDNLSVSNLISITEWLMDNEEDAFSEEYKEEEE